ncbi:DUF6988 family protein [Variovorax sp. DXTD-1]|uniref:DUF6988 family protein n=1 Tax=Variovorax sp. DXTD-1 TaxID=2495592 RepID=UPI000F87A7E1|nr:hypothetical protein [Variovorax sp. DXTD-1]RST51588.1 hypothetical protein EJI00_08420 [Variovorax sp. DXTD-1]
MTSEDIVTAALARSQRLSDWIQAHHPTTVDASDGKRFAAAWYAIAIDHREAIMLLVQRGARSAAFALCRSIYEAWVRASWAHMCASPQEIERFEAQGILPKIETMVRRLDLRLGTTRIFSQIKRSAWESMSDYAHGEQRQIARWFDADGIGAAHPDVEVVALLQALDVYATLCLAGIFDLAGLPTEPCAAKMAEVASA